MSFLILLLITVFSAAATGCPSSVNTSAHITIFSDRFDIMGHLHELPQLRQFAEQFVAAHHTVDIYLYGQLTERLRQHMRAHQPLGALHYTVQDKYIIDYINAMTWQPPATTDRVSHVLILMLDSGYPHVFTKPKVPKLKRAGLEIFVLGYRSEKDYTLDDIASSPAQTHSFSQLQYPSLDHALSALSQSVCRSLEAKERNTKKELLSQVQLVGGRDNCQGRVEVLYNNTWSWLSDEHWDRNTADVICRQLKCGPSVEAWKGEALGPAPGYVLEKALCAGNERDISQCLLGRWGQRDDTKTQHSAGVTCLSSGLGDVRLVNGSGVCDGIVEVSLDQAWHRVCLWNFDLREAAVVCREVGCGPVLKIQEHVMGPGATVQTVEKVLCSGVESQLAECSVSLWSKEPCLYSIHAGIVCSSSVISSAEVTRGSTCYGKVKVYHNTTQSSVCNDHWSVAEEAVLCKQIGCGPAIEMAQVKEMVLRRGPNPQTDFRSVHCGGHEANLAQCGSVMTTGYTCEAEEAEVLCSQSVISQVRLVDGHNACSGRVEVFYKEKWGTVCDEHWDLSDANVNSDRFSSGDLRMV
ncbi:deleted in malignant brain tumors 1 protein-like isoform X2 [Pseudophryne corroboree]|uniref:deleted in malignant brain tumors 1 protein-like isoform X2 n=1 Tax=Pseudophryne corroboree TaxID=495146 RepID=UPI00308208C0